MIFHILRESVCIVPEPICAHGCRIVWGSINNQKNTERDTFETSEQKFTYVTSCIRSGSTYREYCVLRSISLLVACSHMNTTHALHYDITLEIGTIHVEPSNFQQHANSFSTPNSETYDEPYMKSISQKCFNSFTQFYHSFT